MKSSYRSVLCGVAIAVGIAASASAETMFNGMMKVTAVNASCKPGWPSVGNTWTASFHPKAVTGQNGNFSALNRFWDFGGNSWTLNGASFTSTFQPAIHGAIGWNVFIVNNMRSYVRITGQSPALLTPTTPSITLVGQIKNPWTQIGQENCIFTFRMVGLLAN